MKFISLNVRVLESVLRAAKFCVVRSVCELAKMRHLEHFSLAEEEVVVDAELTTIETG